MKGLFMKGLCNIWFNCIWPNSTFFFSDFWIFASTLKFYCIQLIWNLRATILFSAAKSLEIHASMFAFFSGIASGKEPACQCRCKRCEFHSWVRKIPYRRAWQPTPVFLPGESHGQRSLGEQWSIVSQRVRQLKGLCMDAWIFPFGPWTHSQEIGSTV